MNLVIVMSVYQVRAGSQASGRISTSAGEAASDGAGTGGAETEVAGAERGRLA